MKPNAPLTKMQDQILLFLVEGYTCMQIIHKTGKSAPAIHNHLWRIRQKTGIKDLSNQVECLKFITDRAPYLTPTAMQRQVLELLANNKSFDEVASTLGIRPGTAMNHAAEGCKRLQITSVGMERREDIRAALELDRMAPVTMEDPFL